MQEQCFHMLKTVTDTTEQLKAANQLAINPDIVNSTLELYGTLIRKMSPFLVQMMAQHDHHGQLLVHMATIANMALHYNEHPVVKVSVDLSDSKINQQLTRQQWALSLS